MSHRKAVTIVELLVVVAIIGILLSLLIPAVQVARRRARDTVCKNNLHQLNLAVAHFAQAHRRLPGPGAPGVIGGWTIDILPFIEHKNLHDTTRVGTPIPDAAEVFLRQPRIFRCPARSALDDTPLNKMDAGHYVFIPSGRRESFDVFDAPITLKIPWASGPEMTCDEDIRATGPHHRGLYYAQGFQQGIGFMLDGRTVR